MLGSLRFRTAAAYVLLIAAAFAGLGVYVLDKVEGDFRETIGDDLASQAGMIRNLVRPLMEENRPPEAFDDLAKRLGEQSGARITIIAADGTVLGDSEADPASMDNHLNRPEVQDAIRSGQGESNRRSATLGTHFTYVAIRITQDDAVVGVVRVARPSEAVDASVSDITRSILIAVAATAAAAALLSLIIGSTIMRPLGRLVRASRAIAGGDLGQRVSPRPSGELGELADAFNQMTQSLADLIAAASQERNRLTATLNSSIDAVLAVDAEGRTAFANLAAERLFFRSQGEFPCKWGR
jgi:two-component system phosphate regulon sensor histidine kinase PhoR